MRIKVSEKELLNAGYRRVYTSPSQVQEKSLKPGESKLRDLKKGQKIKPRRVRARRQALNEAGLIGLMQSGGIGRPATYAATVDLLLGRNYVQRERGGGLVVTERGRAVLDFLLREYPDLFSLDFTRQMEGLLDDIASRRTSFEKTVLFLQSILG